MAKRVLFVDDSPTIVEAAYDELNEKGYEVDVAYNGVEALKMIEKSIPDIIILDIEMPKLKGYEVAEIIKMRPDLAKIPLIALTAVSLETIGEKAKYFDAYLVKPFGFEEMIEMVEKKIGKP
jgi:chemosensory pili system protein ChpA (sensor histidine kinase/response regulator)